MKTYVKFWALILVTALSVTGCVKPFQQHNLPPAHQLMHPGPGVDGPGPGVLAPQMPVSTMGAAAAPAFSVQLAFQRPDGMQIHFDSTGMFNFTGDPLVVPFPMNFPAGSLTAAKLSNITGREGIELFPTVEVAPVNARTAAYLEHNAIPIQFTDEDIDQVAVGNYVTKVIYLPDPEFQELALAGVETLVSTRLDPGDDPITEADRRGSIMAIVRVGNRDRGAGQPTAGAAAQAAFMVPATALAAHAMAQPQGLPANMGMGGNHVAGLSTPPWGTPRTATPIGLPGPPHLPYGAPAGLQRYTMHNHTKVDIPGPTPTMDIHMRQVPGYSYPKQPSKMFIREQTFHPSAPLSQPSQMRTQIVP